MKADFKKTLDSYKARRGEFRIIDVAPLQYLMVDGHGDPNTAKEYTDAIGAWCPTAYKLKYLQRGGDLCRTPAGEGGPEPWLNRLPRPRISPWLKIMPRGITPMA